MNLITTDNLLERIRELIMIAEPNAGQCWELQELVNRLDDSLSEGGALPTRWTRNRDKAVRQVCDNESVRPQELK